MSVAATDYHSDTTTLSNSGAKWLLPPHCPAKFRWIQDHPEDRPTTAALDFGKAAHRYAFGAGEDFIVITGSGKDPNAWNTTATKEEVQQARAAGLTPIKPQDEAIIIEMGEALRAHPLAAALFDPEHGKAEVPLYWTDPATGVPLRCRLDWLPEKRSGKRLLIPDLKTAESAHPEKFRKSAMDYGYHRQADFYTRGVRECGLDDDPAFLFVVVEKSPPYLVQVIELKEASLNIGRNLNNLAISTYAECMRTGRWPSYDEGVVQIDLPDFYLRQHDEESAA
jgi:hypothetical protein